MSVFIPEIEDIYFPQTKEYFREIMSSYANGNYRSATVMLYSVAVCDIMLKLQELKDMYNDSVAISILNAVDQSRGNNSFSRSKWEKDLINRVYKETSLLDMEAFTHLNHLYDDRNFSAHPALNENYELVSPSRETTIANIKNVLNDILIKPPIFIKSIISFMTDDLQERKDTFLLDYDVLKTYLNNRYYSKMTDSMKIATFKALWKFCFRSPEDEACMRNRTINRGALEILSPHVYKAIIDSMDAEPQLYDVADNDKCLINFIRFLSVCPNYYQHMQSHIKKGIDRVIKECPEYLAFAWFKFDSLQNHIDALKKNKQFELTEKNEGWLRSYYSAAGQKQLLLSFYISYYGSSPSFDSANKRYEFLQPHLAELTSDQLVDLITATDANRQVYDRWKAPDANLEIVNAAKEKLGKDFDYSIFPNFKYEAEESKDSSINPEDLPF